ncbi:GNAT family N-acetyltransferase [Embleya sp. NPDC055612]
MGGGRRWDAPAGVGRARSDRIRAVWEMVVDPAVRGRGLGRMVCAFVLAEARGRHGRAALMVDEWNHAAVRMYEGLGMVYRPVKAAAWRSGR